MTTSGEATVKATSAAEPATATTATSTDQPKLSTTRDSSWPAVLFYIHLNILGLYGIVILFTNTYLTTVIFTILLIWMGIVGVTCGAHRLWAHQTYKANTFLRIVLMLCQTMAGQVCISILLVRHIELRKSFIKSFVAFNTMISLFNSIQFLLTRFVISDPMN